MVKPSSVAPAALPNGAKLVSMPHLNMSKVHAMFSTPWAFVSMCQIVREDESIGYLDPTNIQMKFLQACSDHRWVITSKFRQAKITTPSVMLLLRDCMYLEGVKGVLIAERQDTAEDIFERILFAYNRLPEDVKVPVENGRKPGTTQIHFCHGGGIKVLTAGGRSPAVGRSIDRLLITEFGEAQWQQKAAINIFPAVNKRPNARVILESTPGASGSHYETMWRNALDPQGASRFHPVFLEWWLDPSCRSPVEGFIPTDEEMAYLKMHKGMTLENLAFRRQGLRTEFVGDPRLFSCKYPSDPYDGWLGKTNPVMPIDVLRARQEDCIAPPTNAPHGSWEMEHPRPGRKYLVCVDPAGFGSSGDYSALTVWDTEERREVAVWEGREDPGTFARRLLVVQRRYNGTAMLAVESNAAACIATLKDRGTKNLLWTDRNHPGWYATDKRIQEAEARLVRMLRENDITIRSRTLLHQLLDYDGSRRERRGDGEGNTKHFDLARTAVMAGDILSRRKFVSDGSPVANEEVEQTDGPRVTISDLDRFKSMQARAARNPFSPASRSWS